eukprot:TRINITY_DN4882_c0_g1_i6.p1 TRINITY_DN4882_c0_g1~~TRINITY_DN4882_c0_g1_i6.p1  ORF type:complete len:168 (-),score=44.80 TRINITY_DN4882_c0_g1_i6:101-604(-)
MGCRNSGPVQEDSCGGSAPANVVPEIGAATFAGEMDVVRNEPVEPPVKAAAVHVEEVEPPLREALEALAAVAAVSLEDKDEESVHFEDNSSLYGSVAVFDVERDGRRPFVAPTSIEEGQILATDKADLLLPSETPWARMSEEGNHKWKFFEFCCGPAIVLNNGGGKA